MNRQRVSADERVCTSEINHGGFIPSNIGKNMVKVGGASENLPLFRFAVSQKQLIFDELNLNRLVQLESEPRSG